MDAFEKQEIGKFWLPATPSHTVAGTMDLVNGRPQLQVVGDITKPPLPEGAFFLPSFSGADRTLGSDMTIHGYVAGSAGPVTLLDMGVVQEVQAMPGLTTQSIRGQFLLRGAHVENSSSFSGVRISVKGLDEWHAKADTSVSYHPELRRTTVVCEPSAPEELELPDSQGLLSLLTGVTMPQVNIRGVRVDSEVVLEWAPSPAGAFPTLREALERFVRPVKSFFTTLLDEPSDIYRIQMRVATSNTWVEVFGSEVRGSRHQSCIPLLSKDEAGLDVIGAWISNFSSLTPIPHVVAGVISSKIGYLEAELLTLCTATEGLHRRLYPGRRKLTQEDMAAAQAVLKGETSGIPAEVRGALLSATEYLWEPGLPMRVEELAARLVDVCPEVFGKLNRWKRSVAQARNASAHLLASEDGSDDWKSSYILAQSLRWFLRALLLQNAGVRNVILRERLLASPRFTEFIRNSGTFLPLVYRTGSNPAQAPAAELPGAHGFTPGPAGRVA